MPQATNTSASGRPRWLKPVSWMGRLTLWAAVFTLSCTLLRILFGGRAVGLFFGSCIGWGLLLLAAFAFILLVQAINRRLLWKVRNRLIVTYVLLGLAPVVLFGTLTAIAGYIFAGQFSINSALAGLDEASNQLKIEAASLADLLTQPGMRERTEAMHFEQTNNPRETEISIAVLRNGTWRTLPLHTDRGPSPSSPFDGIPQPMWLHTGFGGVVVRGGKLYLCRVAGANIENRSAEVLTALELNRNALSSVEGSLGRVLLFSGFAGNHRIEIDDAEREAQIAEKDADRADAQRDAQRDADGELRDARRDQQQAKDEATKAVREAQRELSRAQGEIAKPGASDADSGSQEELDEAKRNLSETEHQAMQVAQTPSSPNPPNPPAVPAKQPQRPPSAQLPASRPKKHSADVGAPIAHPADALGAAPESDDDSFAAVSGSALPAAAHFFDPPVYFTAPLPVFGWAEGQQHSAMLVVISRPSTLYTRLFSTSVEMGSMLRNVMIGIALAFAFIELLALWMASRLSGTITRSVAELYRGTTEIDKGNLDYRVKPRRADQLGALASSFNRMASSIKDLLVQQRERDRLLNELAIAQEVQQNLFPHSPVSVSGLQMHAVCLPARSVSGDYFDFILGHNTLSTGTGACIALGDISGKGISAALLMATLHSAVRAFSLRENAGMPSPAEQLALLNTHLFSSTQSNRYATLFLAFYDAGTRRLTYSNGGHLPPFLISADGTVRRLGVGGPVVGLLEDLHYEEATVELYPGDLLAAFTDGMTEPENGSGEDFGESRLLRLLEANGAQSLPSLADSTFEALKLWIAEQEQPDDMTLLLARQH